jgi:Double zinc ribbon
MIPVDSKMFSAEPFPCGHENPDDHLFCDVCGRRRSSRCPSCQASNRGTANFCGRCGDRLTASPMSEGAPEPRAEPPTDLQSPSVPSGSPLASQATPWSSPVSLTSGPGDATADRTSCLPAESRLRCDPASKYSMATDGAENALPPIEAGSAVPRTLRRPPAREPERRELIPPTDGEAEADTRLQGFLAECEAAAERRRRGRVSRRRALALGILLAATLAAVLFGAQVWRGRHAVSSSPRFNPLSTPATSEALAGAAAPLPPTGAGSSRSTEGGAPLGGVDPLRERVEPMLSPVQPRSTLGRDAGGGAAASGQSKAVVDSTHVMARDLIAKLGRERAEETARLNATWYPAGSQTFVYWQRVATPSALQRCRAEA